MRPMKQSLQTFSNAFLSTKTPQTKLTAGDAVWIATALLHKDSPRKTGFTVKEIEARVAQERLWSDDPKTIYHHAQSHAVANQPLHLKSRGLRLLYADGPLRRLYRPGDDFDPARRNGREMTEQRLPERYRSLWPWYLSWSKSNRKPEGTVQRNEDPLLALVATGRDIWADEHADEYVRRLREDWE